MTLRYIYFFKLTYRADIHSTLLSYTYILIELKNVGYKKHI